MAVRLEPIILELEREQNDLLIIAHESVLRVLYGYLMACNATDIPSLSFPRNEIIEIVPASYNNEATRILIPDLDEDIVPPSPEHGHVRTPAPSGMASPLNGLGTPRANTPDNSSESSKNNLLASLKSGEGTRVLIERSIREKA